VFVTATAMAAMRWAEDYHLFVIGSIELELRLRAAQLAAARTVEPPGESWEVYARRLETEFSERWALVEPPSLDEVLADYYDR
jgi:hypothetical protein